MLLVMGNVDKLVVVLGLNTLLLFNFSYVSLRFVYELVSQNKNNAKEITSNINCIKNIDDGRISQYQQITNVK